MFYAGGKKLSSDFLRKWGWFYGHDVCFPKISAQNQNLKKLIHNSVDERAMITTTFNTFLSLEKLCTFLVAKEKTWKHIFHTNSELSRNHTKKKFMPSKTTLNWLFNHILCYFAIACFDWKIEVLGFVRVCKGLVYH